MFMLGLDCLGECRRRAARRVADDGDGVRADVEGEGEEVVMAGTALFARAMRDDLRGENGSQESAKPSRGVGGVRMCDEGEGVAAAGVVAMVIV